MSHTSINLDTREESMLLDLVRQALLAGLKGENFSPAPDALPQAMGFFLTLLKNGEVFFSRGEAFPELPLGQALPLFAHKLAASLSDAPAPDELSFELDLIGPGEVCTKPDGIDLNKQFIHMESRGRAAAFPPRYPLLHGWSARGTLEQMCKAVSLPPGVWRDKTATVTVCDYRTLSGGPLA